MALLDSTWLLLRGNIAQLGSTWLYYILPWLYLTLPDSTTLYYGSTLLYQTLQYNNVAS